MCSYLRGHKHVLELAYSKHSVFKKMRLHEATQTDSDCFKEQSCTYVVGIRPLVPTAEFCASLIVIDNSTIFGLLQLGTLHGNQCFSPAPG